VSLDAMTGDVILSIVEAPPGMPGVLRSGRLTAFATWPPTYGGMIEGAPSVLDYVTGDGAEGPVALLRVGTGQLALATTFLPQVVMMNQTPGDHPLFVAGIADRWLYGASQKVTSFTKLDVGSYQTGSLEQVEAPSACLASHVLAAGTPTANGFVAAYALPNPPTDACPTPPAPGTVLQFFRYDAPAPPGSFLVSTPGDVLVAPEPFTGAVLSRASFGAWVFHQTDPGTALQPPAVFAIRVDAQAHITPVAANSVVVAPDGAASGPFTAAALGDDAALAWVTAEPAASTLSVRTITMGGTLGDVVTFSTNPVPQTGRVRAIASKDRRSLLLAWEAGSHVGLARLDCVPTH
jgi:hypothetical protein